MKIYVLQNAHIIAEGAATIKDPTQPIGSNVFDGRAAMPRARPGRHGLPCRPDLPTATNTNVLQRIDGAPDVMDVIRDRIKPGTVLVTTDSPATPETRSGSGFTVMDAPSSPSGRAHGGYRLNNGET